MQSKYAVTAQTFMDAYKYPHKYAIRPFKICGNLYYVGNTSVSSHLIDTGDGLILLDTTFPHTYPLLINSIWELGFSLYDIKYIVHSHGHFDHFGGTVQIAALTQAKTFLGAEDAKMFRERPELMLLKDCPYSYLEPFTPDVELKDNDTIPLGNTTIRAISTPGHSPGVMSYLFDVTDGNTRRTAAMHGGAGFNTLNLPFLREYGLDAEGVRGSFIDGITRLEGETVDITLGNHPNQNDTVGKRGRMLANPSAGNPFIDRTEWPRFLADIKKRFSIMLEEERTSTLIGLKTQI
ncbi:MAG: MBL fold metallo-hydrolase [Spirochaetales bacterium]|jgi:metallo-beta-lactamase class B|nr:MBL fold metallo-hydrolase [Spirochaetales bacterium]